MIVTDYTMLVRLARAVLEHWENGPDFALCQQLHQAEPIHIQASREVLRAAAGRVRLNVRPKEVV